MWSAMAIVISPSKKPARPLISYLAGSERVKNRLRHTLKYLNLKQKNMKIMRRLLLTILFGITAISAIAQSSINLQLEDNFLHLPVSYE